MPLILIELINSEEIYLQVSFFTVCVFLNKILRIQVKTIKPKYHYP